MSEVVIRCPNCGTTGITLGECDACHDAERRYFCTNHKPGRWLDGPACAACGAHFGVDRAPPRQAARPIPEPPHPRPEPREPLGTRPPVSAEPEWTIEDILDGPARTPHRAKVEGPGTRDPRFELPPEAPFPPFGVRVVPIGGCVRRLVVLAVILLALAALAFFGLLGIGSRLLFGASLVVPRSYVSAAHATSVASVPIDSRNRER